MSWKITFLNRKVEHEALEFPQGILADLLHVLEMIEEMGPDLGRPYAAPMGCGLFEIRARCKEGIGRSLFCTKKGQEIVILHLFVKKTQRTPKQDLDLARRRQREMK
ncbi:MAG: type II toxin-antitoxin system RelE/ParE family toxin [Gammaproteobacteria bacterium]|nr:type II toxin-antitoxin system RelE/ParE family toxin [Gammaproteobacteria bacterium]